MKLPKFDEEKHLAARLKSPIAMEKYERAAIGQQIRKNRRKVGLTQSQLARRAGTTQSVIARIENGKQNFTLRTLIIISYLLNKRLDVRLI